MLLIISHFVTFFKIKHVHIRLPNYSYVLRTVNYVGTIQFTDKFIIFNAMCILEFTFNLISVQR